MFGASLTMAIIFRLETTALSNPIFKSRVEIASLIIIATIIQHYIL